jgi:hypothetical protein
MAKQDLTVAGVITDGKHIWLVNPNDLEEDFQNQLPNILIEKEDDAHEALVSIADDLGLFVLSTKFIADKEVGNNRIMGYFVTVLDNDETVTTLNENDIFVKRPIGSDQ